MFALGICEICSLIYMMLLITVKGTFGKLYNFGKSGVHECVDLISGSSV